MEDVVAGRSAQVLFGGVIQDKRYPNPETSGGHIALIAVKNNPVQVPPMSLERMHASLQKQIAFNRRVLKAEDQVAGINSGMGDFLQDMSFESSEGVFVCVNVDHTARGNQPVGGQLWTQSGRQMTATNLPFDGMDYGKESVVLSAVEQAVTWRHALENTTDPSFQRKGQRVIVYAKFLTKLETVLRWTVVMALPTKESWRNVCVGVKTAGHCSCHKAVKQREIC
jgi:hypothetical protein